jgi:anti-sigma B factor antagonist
VYPDGFPVERAGDQAVVELPAEVDISSADLLRDQLLALLEQGVRTLIVDMSGTTFCDSAALGALITAQKRAAESAAELRLVAMAAPVLRVMTIIGVDRLIPIHPTLAAARSGGGQPAPGPSDG